MVRYNVIYADPPWEVRAGPGFNLNGKSRSLTYPVLSVAEIELLPVKNIAAVDAHLYLCVINKYVEQAYAIARAWGFKPSCLITWTKAPMGLGLGGTFVQTTEHVLFCRRGQLKALKRYPSTWFAAKRGRHSEKPQILRQMIEETSPGNRIELFARKKHAGWEVWGNEVASDIVIEEYINI